MFRTPKFTLTSAAVEQMRVMRADYLEHFSDDPPVVAGIFVGAPMKEGLKNPRIIIGFWRQSEFSKDNPEWKNTVHLAGLDILFDVPDEHKKMFVGKAIDYSPDNAFYLRPS